MKITPLSLDGVALIELTPQTDERGFFARVFCRDEFAEAGLNPSVPQMNLSYNRTCGTLRGMHFQQDPYSETKVVRCLRGAIYDVVVDLRRNSSTWGKWIGVDLTAENRHALYIPDGFAHGFQTLADDSEVLYLMGERFVPGSAAGVRYDDPRLNIRWPRPVSVISEKDLSYPHLRLPEVP